MASSRRLWSPASARLCLGAVLCLASSSLVESQQTSPSQPSQSPPLAPATISGTVVALVGGSPLRRAEVTLVEQGAPGGPSHVAVTDEAGRYEIRSITPGRYSLIASKPPYVSLAYGQKGPLDIGTTLELQSGERRERLHLALPRHGVISGVLLDEAGEPLSGATVHTARVHYRDWQLSYGWGTSAMTDDLGRFRLYGLPPGQHQVWAVTTSEAVPINENRLGFLPTYYPGTEHTAQGRTIAVAADEEVGGVSLMMRPGRTGTMAGVVYGADGALRPGAIVMLAPMQPSGALDAAGGHNVISKTGAFTFDGVAPGDYRLTAIGDHELAFADITFTGTRPTDMAMTLSPGRTLRGRVVVPDGDTAPDPTTVSVSILPLDTLPAGQQPVVVAKDLTVEAKGIHSRRILVRAAAPGWVLTRVTVDGADRTDEPIDLNDRNLGDIEIVLRRPSTEVAGTLTDSQGRGVASTTIVIFAEDPAKWTKGTRFVARTTTDARGAFTYRGLPPARYVVVATGAIERGAEMSAEALEMWRPSGTAITLRDGPAAPIRLRVPL